MTTTSTPKQRNILLASATALAIGGAGYASSVLFTGGMDLGAASQTPLVAASNAISAAAAVALSVQLPSFWSPTRLPKWAVYVTAAGLAFLGAFAFAMLTVVPHFGLILGEPQVFDAETVWGDALGYPKQVLLLVGLTAVAVAGKIRGVFGWPIAIALAIAGVVNALLWPFAPGALVTGIALALCTAVRTEERESVGASTDARASQRA